MTSSLKEDYYTYGGMPFILSLNSHEDKSRYLRDLFERTYIKDVLEKTDLDLKQMLVLARPGETVYGIDPNSSSKNDTWKVVGMTIDEEGTWYRLEDEKGNGWNLDTAKFLKYVSTCRAD